MPSKNQSAAKASIHPQLAEWLPGIEPEEMHQLRLNLERNGCLDPVKVWRQNGNIYVIDGHQRKALCEELGIPYEIVELKLDSIEAVKLWMIDFQGGRRNWTESQRAFAVAEALKLKMGFRGKPKTPTKEGGSKCGPSTFSPPTVAEASRETGTDRATLSQAVAVSEHGSEALKEAVRAGEVHVKKAAKVAKLPKSEQVAALKQDVPPPELPTAERLLDEVGKEIPEHLVEAFSARAVFDESLSLLTQLSKLVNPLIGDPRANVKGKPGGEHVERQRVRALIEELRTCLRFAKPYAVCPKHAGKDGVKCLRCGVSGEKPGWMVKHSYDNCGIK